MKKTLTAVLTFLLAAAAGAKELSPAAAAKAFDAAWNSGRAEDVLALCADDVEAVFRIGSHRREVRGRAQMAEFVRAQIAGAKVKGSGHKADGATVRWENAVSNDRFRSMGVEEMRYRSEAVVEGGRVRRFAAEAEPDSAARYEKAAAEANKKTVAAYVEEVGNRHNIGAVDKFLAPGFVDAAALKGRITEIFVAFPDVRFEVLDMIAEGDKVAARVRARGTHRGPYMGRAATGRPVDVEEIHIHRLEDGRFAERWGLLDTAALLEQIKPAETKKKN